MTRDPSRPVLAADATAPAPAASTTTAQAVKAPWTKPAIVFREPLEMVAVTCVTPGKANPGTCPRGPISS